MILLENLRSCTRQKKPTADEFLENMQDTNGIMLLNGVQIGMKFQPHEENKDM